MFWVLARNNDYTGRPMEYHIVEYDGDLTDCLDIWIWPWTVLGPYKSETEAQDAFRANIRIDSTGVWWDVDGSWLYFTQSTFSVSPDSVISF